MEKRTGGRVKVDFRWAGTLTAPLESLSHLKSGVSDLGYAPASYFPSELGGLVSFTTLYIGKDPVTTINATNKLFFDSGDLSTKLQKEYEKQNIKMLFEFTSANYVMWSKNPIRTVADLKGLKVRSTGTYQPKVYIRLGMVPVSTTSAEMYDSLAKGLVDVVPMPWSVGQSYKLTEVAKWVSFDSGGSADIYWQMNLDSWKKLPADIQKIIDDLRPDVIQVSGKGTVEEDKLMKDKALASGVQVTEIAQADKDAFFKAWKEVIYVEWFQAMQKRGLGTDAQKILDTWLPLMGY